MLSFSEELQFFKVIFPLILKGTKWDFDRNHVWEEMYSNMKWTRNLKLGKRENAGHKILTDQGTLLP